MRLTPENVTNKTDGDKLVCTYHMQISTDLNNKVCTVMIDDERRANSLLIVCLYTETGNRTHKSYL